MTFYIPYSNTVRNKRCLNNSTNACYSQTELRIFINLTGGYLAFVCNEYSVSSPVANEDLSVIKYANKTSLDPIRFAHKIRELN